MQFSQLFATSVILAGGAYAQTASSTSSAASASGSVTVHVIQASDPNNAKAFLPNAIRANVGDMVQFQLYPMNHSIVMGEFDNPCMPVQNDPNAWFSGFMPVQNMADGGRLTYTIQVKDTNPMWYYCSQANHCQEGMVGVINPPQNSQQTIQAYTDAAKNAQENVTPNSASGAGQVGGESSASTTPSVTGAAATAAPTTASANILSAAKRSFVGMTVAGVVALLML